MAKSLLIDWYMKDWAISGGTVIFLSVCQQTKTLKGGSPIMTVEISLFACTVFHVSYWPCSLLNHKLCCLLVRVNVTQKSNLIAVKKQPIKNKLNIITTYCLNLSTSLRSPQVLRCNSLFCLDESISDCNTELCVYCITLTFSSELLNLHQKQG